MRTPLAWYRAKVEASLDRADREFIRHWTVAQRPGTTPAGMHHRERGRMSKKTREIITLSVLGGAVLAGVGYALGEAAFLIPVAIGGLFLWFVAYCKRKHPDIAAAADARRARYCTKHVLGQPIPGGPERLVWVLQPHRTAGNACDGPLHRRQGPLGNLAQWL
jgi:hypothetical protein